MNKYEQLISGSDDNIIIIEKHFKSKAKGLCNGNKIGISKSIGTSVEKACVLAEELGHYHTTVGNITDLENPQNRKQERQARLWAYNKLIGLMGLINAYEQGCRTLHDVAEYLDVTEEFLQEAVDCYREKYGECVTVGSYYILFIPSLAVGKII